MGSNEDPFTRAMELINSTSFTMVLENIIKLKVLETIAEAGPDARLYGYDIASRLSIPNQDAPDMLDKMLHLLASHSIVTCTEGVHESRRVRVYGLTPVAKYFIPNEQGVSLGPFMQLILDKVLTDGWFELKDAVLNGGVPFNKVHGAHAFEYPAIDARFNELFNKGMVNHTTILMKEILKHYRGFNNLKCVVDVGGGLGITLSIEHVGGDMFKEVPQGDAISMKWILHDWDDGSCVKLLKNCYKALPDNGKVIIVEAILPFLPDTSSSVKVTTYLDVSMMTQNPGGKERTEDEFLALVKSAGFKGIRKECFICNFWVMEFYK
ncbi:hypothetical protein SSX86_003449 [Deinandra increscens subsp. villosa]|uniref:Caffeic acid O-methyltransferase n=1 Tax=Deinandra increscens subsp. villosa TaxID=3103831 RepID=A0AAP0DQ12_9ASTR